MKKQNVKTVGQIFVWIGVLIYFVWIFAPFLIVILTSFTTEMQLMGSKQFVWRPDPFSTEGYNVLFELDPNKVNGVPSLFIGFFNTLWQTLIPTVCGLLVSGLAAFCYAKYDFPGKSKFFAANLVLMTIPLSAGFADYLFYNAIGWTQGSASVLPLIVPKMFGGATTIFFIYPYIKALPSSIIEAAKIDGRGFFGIFFRIVLPIALPSMVAIFVLQFLATWSDYNTFILWLPSYPSLSVGVYKFQQEASRQGLPMPVVLATLIIVIIPTTALYLGTQKILLSKFNVGGLKG